MRSNSVIGKLTFLIAAFRLRCPWRCWAYPITLAGDRLGTSPHPRRRPKDPGPVFARRESGQSPDRGSAPGSREGSRCARKTDRGGRFDGERSSRSDRQVEGKGKRSRVDVPDPDPGERKVPAAILVGDLADGIQTMLNESNPSFERLLGAIETFQASCHRKLAAASLRKARRRAREDRG